MAFFVFEQFMQLVIDQITKRYGVYSNGNISINFRVKVCD